jgi:integrase
MNHGDVRQIIAVIGNIRDWALILVLLRTGMRIGELLAMKVNDLDIRERKMHIFEGEKNSLGRVVYLSDDVLFAVRLWLAKRDPDKEFLFYGQGRDRLVYSSACHLFVKYLSRARLEYKAICGSHSAPHVRQRALERGHAPRVPPATPRLPQHRDDPALCPTYRQNTRGRVLPCHGSHRTGRD